MEFPGSGDTFAFATLRAVAAYPGIYRHYPRPADGRSRWTETSSRQCGAQRQHRSEIFSFIQSPARRSVGNNREWTIMDANLRRAHSCQFAFILGCEPSWAGWTNHEWTRMDANLGRTHSCQFAFILGCEPSWADWIKPE